MEITLWCIEGGGLMMVRKQLRYWRNSFYFNLAFGGVGREGGLTMERRRRCGWGAAGMVTRDG